MQASTPQVTLQQPVLEHTIALLNDSWPVSSTPFCCCLRTLVNDVHEELLMRSPVSEDVAANTQFVNSILVHYRHAHGIRSASRTLLAPVCCSNSATLRIPEANKSGNFGASQLC